MGERAYRYWRNFPKALQALFARTGIPDAVRAEFTIPGLCKCPPPAFAHRVLLSRPALAESPSTKSGQVQPPKKFFNNLLKLAAWSLPYTGEVAPMCFQSFRSNSKSSFNSA